MNKSVYAFVVILALAVLLAACGSPSPATSVTVVVTAPPQVVEVTKVVAGTPVTEKVIVTATPEPTANPYDDNAPITVWIDQDRQPYIDAYIKANPDKARLIQGIHRRPGAVPGQGAALQQHRPGLARCGFCRAASGRPRGRCGAQFPARSYAVGPADVLKGYAGMAGCTFGDKIYCLRNDLAQFVMYYNKPLMDKFGYTRCPRRSKNSRT